jgi:hypothetical protein
MPSGLAARASAGVLLDTEEAAQARQRGSAVFGIALLEHYVVIYKLRCVRLAAGHLLSHGQSPACDRGTEVARAARG